MANNILSEFPITVYGMVTPYNDVVSKARCRIFYKGLNRNGGYITDEFAKKLISTVPYTPVKGIYNEEEGDYTDHGAARNLGRIYGIVPENPNGSFELHPDEDGVNREYFCVDVLLFTAIYGDEATSIVGKAQSMELYAPSIEGTWQVKNGKSVFVYDTACFLGLQVLGENVEPCFEGAAFYTLQDKLNEIMSKINEYELKVKQSVEGGISEMPELNFKLSDSEKHGLLWDALNVNFTEEGNWTIDTAICDIYDDYALTFNYEDGSYYRVAYTKDNEANTVTIGEKTRVFIVDVSETELAALKMIQSLNGGSYEKAEEVYTKVTELETEKATLETEKAEFEQKIVEHENSLATLQTEKDELQASFDELTNNFNSLTEEVNSLHTYKETIEKAEKEAVIEKYTSMISEEIMNSYKENLDTYSAESLEKELAFEMVKGNPSIFSKAPETHQPQLVLKDQPLTGIEGIISKHKK